VGVQNEGDRIEVYYKKEAEKGRELGKKAKGRLVVKSRTKWYV